jgi:exonuclease VII small subunit
VTGGVTIDSGGMQATGGLTLWETGLAVTGGVTVNLGGVRVTGGVTINLDGLKVTGGLTVYDSGFQITGTSYIYGDLRVSGAVYSNNVQLSDIRLKENISPLADSLTTISKLRGVYFSWKDQDEDNLHYDNKRHVGLIAQEVQAAIPEVVDNIYDGRYLGVRYYELIPLIINAIKELDNRDYNKEKGNATETVSKNYTESLESRLDALEASNEALEASNEALEASNEALVKANISLKNIIDILNTRMQVVEKILKTE